MESLKAGNQTAFEMIFRSYYQSLCNYAHTFLPDREEAEEVVQNSFVSLWEKKEELDIRTSTKSYLFSMVRNASLNRVRHEKVRQRHAQQHQLHGEYVNEANPVEAEELEHKIWKAMEKLPEQCRLVFKMSRFEEMRYAEIAEHLNISVKTVENQIGKALKIMREQLSEYLPVILLIINGIL